MAKWNKTGTTPAFTAWPLVLQNFFQDKKINPGNNKTVAETGDTAQEQATDFSNPQKKILSNMSIMSNTNNPTYEYLEPVNAYRCNLCRGVGSEIIDTIIEHTTKEIRGAMIDERIWRSQFMNPAEAGLSFTRYSEDTPRLEIYPSSGDYWKCVKCKDRGDRWYMLDHICSGGDDKTMIEENRL